jgi:hypothetical protein
MVAPIHVLDSCQVGLETSRVSGLIAATSILDHEPGGVVLKRNPNNIRVRNASSYATSHRTYSGQDEVEIEVSGTWSYNWAPWWFNLFLGPLATGTGPTAFVWAFGSAVVSDIADNVKSASFEVSGKDARAGEYKIAGCVGKSLSISIKQDAAWTYKATLIGMALTIAAKTGALAAIASIVDVLGTTTKVYCNGTASAFGATQLAGTVISADVDIKLGTVARFTLDGNRGPTRVAVTGARDVSAKVVMEYDAQTLYTAVHAGTAQRLRIGAIGPTLGGSTYTCNLDIPGVFDVLDFGDDDGVVTQELTLVAQYDSTPAADINASVTNAIGTLP